MMRSSSSSSAVVKPVEVARCTKPPRIRSISLMPRWVARHSRRLRRISSLSLAGWSLARALLPHPPLRRNLFPLTIAPMRPPLLNPLFAGAAGLKGIGEKLDRLLARFPAAIAMARRATTTRIIDLLFHLPSGIVDRRFRPRIADLPREGVVTVEVTVGKPPRRRRRCNKRVPYRVDVSDGTGILTLVFFHCLCRQPEAHAARGRDALRVRQDRLVQRRAADGPSRITSSRPRSSTGCRSSSRSIP